MQAKAYGASHIASTCSPRNDELVKSLGADETVNYRENDVFDVMRKAGKQFDIIYDTVGAGKAVWDGAASGVLAQGGQLVTITGDVQRTLGTCMHTPENSHAYKLGNSHIYMWADSKISPIC